MIKKAIYLVVIGLLVVSMASDWSRIEPKDMALGISFIYDINEDNEIVITVEILDMAGSAATGYVNKHFLVKQKGKTIADALRDVEMKLEKNIYGIHSKARFFTERFAQTHMEVALEFFSRDKIADERPYMFVIKGDESNLYQSDLGLSDLVGKYVNKMAMLKKKSSTSTVFITTFNYFRDFYNDGKQNVMGVIEVMHNDILTEEDVNDEEKQQEHFLKLEGLAVMKNNKLVGYLDRYESRTYNFLVDKVQGATIAVPVGDRYDTYWIGKSTRKIKTSFENGQVVINIEIKNNLAILENCSEFRLSELSESNKAEKVINEFLENETKASIAKLQTEFASDIFGFGDYFHMQNPKKWHEIKDEWQDNYFVNAQINVKANNSIRLEGSLSNKFGERVTHD